MRKVFDEYGGTIIVVIAVVALIGLVAFLMQPGGTMDKAFTSLVHSFTAKSESLTDVPPSVEALQERHSFEYYSSLGLAVTDVNNGTIGDNADAEKEDAVAGVYTDEGKTYVVLLKDTTETTTVSPAVDMTINLGGHVLSSADTVGVNITAGNVAIDGRLNGSTIQVKHTQSTKARTIVVDAGATLTVDSGTYICSTEGDKSRCILSEGNLTLSNATVIGTETTGSIRTIQVTGETTISNCTITATSNGTIKGNSIMGVAVAGPTTISDCSISAISPNQNAYGVYTWQQASTVAISNSAINAYSNHSSSDGNSYSTPGISNSCTLTLNDCSIMGIHCGVSNKGTLYVNGGTYEGYGHGGLYFAGAGNTSYVRNATIRECAMPDGYSDLGGGCNGSGFYIGGSSANNNAVYMDNCDIYGSRQPIVLRGTSNEQNNTLHISNSRINKNYTDMGVRIDNDTHRLYIGQNCNFDISDCAPLPSQPQFDMSTAVFETDEVYFMSE